MSFLIQSAKCAEKDHTTQSDASVRSLFCTLAFCFFSVYSCFSQNPGDVLINEIVTDPQMDWGSGDFGGTTPGNTINENDEWIELYITQSGLDLSGWSILASDETPFSGDLTSSGAFQSSIYLGVGTFENTVAGDYLLLGNPQMSEQMSNSVTIALRSPLYDIIDEVTISNSAGTGFDGFANADLNFESVSRIPNGQNSGDLSNDFVQTRATIGANNSPLGSVLINEVVTDPVQDWSSAGFSTLNPGGNAGENDEWIELLIQSSGLNLTKWRILVQDTSPLEGDLTDTSAFQVSAYIGSGTFNNTIAGDYLILGNPAGGVEDINNSVYISLNDPYGNVVDDVELGNDPRENGASGEGPNGASSGIGDESVSRIPFAEDTDVYVDDFHKGPPSLGAENGVIYVDGNAIDDGGQGTLSDPKQLIQSGIGIVSPDGTVYVRSGSYSESVIVSSDLFLLPEVGTHVLDLELNGGDLRVLASSFTVDNSLTMTSGVLDMDPDDGDKSDDPSFVLPSIVIGNAYNSTTHFEGKIQYEVSGASSFTFHVGDEGDYRPVTVQPSNTANFEISHLSESTPGNMTADLVGATSSELAEEIESVLVSRHWQVDLATGSGSPGETQITLELDGVDGVTSSEGLGMARYNGVNWEEMTLVNSTGTGPYQVSGSASEFSPISVYASSSNANPLPVVLMHFRGDWVRPGIFLTWATASEINASFFEVHHSVDGVEFQAIGVINARGDSNEQIDYSFTDPATPNRPHYYRLRMVDFDGTFELSKIIQISPDFSNTKIEVFPNPASETLKITGVQSSFIEELLIYDLNTQLRKKVKAFPNESISISDLSAGYYFLKIKLTDGSRFGGKFLKK